MNVSYTCTHILQDLNEKGVEVRGMIVNLYIYVTYIRVYIIFLHAYVCTYYRIFNEKGVEVRGMIVNQVAKEHEAEGYAQRVVKSQV